MIYAIPVAATLHLLLGLVIQYPAWRANGRTFDRPPAPATPDIDLPELGELLEEAERLTAKPVPEIPVPAQAATLAEPVEVLVIPVPEPEPDGLEDMTTKKLRELARGRVPGFSKMTKATLIARLRELG
jgi:hypothetical protein